MLTVKAHNFFLPVHILKANLNSVVSLTSTSYLGKFLTLIGFLKDQGIFHSAPLTRMILDKGIK